MTVVDSPTKNFITQDNFRLAYNIYGDEGNPVIFLIHGMGLERSTWRTTLPYLMTRFKVVTFDLLGFGESERPAEADYSVEGHGKRLLQLAGALKIQEFAVMGHSMGGQIALMIAAMIAPERVTQVVAVDSPVSGQMTGYTRFTFGTAVRLGALTPGAFVIPKQFIRFRPAAQLYYGRNMFYDIKQVPREVWQAMGEVLMDAFQYSPMLKNYQAIVEMDLTTHLQRIKVPTLAIYGDNSNVVPLREGQLIKEHVDTSELVVVENCGHMPMFEQTEAYLAALKGFFTAR